MLFNKPMFVTNNPSPPPSIDYLCFTSGSAFSVAMGPVAYVTPTTVPSLEYSKDGTNWTTFTAGTDTISASANEKVYLRGNNSFINSHGSDGYWKFILTGTGIEASGNIMSLLDKTCQLKTITTDGCFENLFYKCATLTAAPRLPATTLSAYCYVSMFAQCRTLTTAPELPAMVLKYCCYNCMFERCSITSAPKLPATTLAEYCYKYMFYGNSVRTIPKLPATYLPNSCYDHMFGSSSYALDDVQSDEYPYPYRIPYEGTGTAEYYALDSMFGNIEPLVNTTYYARNEPV